MARLMLKGRQVVWSGNSQQPTGGELWMQWMKTRTRACRNFQTMSRISAPRRSPPTRLRNAINSQPFSYWLRKFFACNPFYLVSAALLLYGLYLVSADVSFLSLSQLIFNFGSLQIYEILLVATAIFLARRRIWYDSHGAGGPGKHADPGAVHFHQPGRATRPADSSGSLAWRPCLPR